MRTVKRKALLLNKAKQAIFEQLCRAYANEKRYWLEKLKSNSYLSRLGNYRQIRDEAVKNKYQSRYGLQGRQWKLALQDAVETLDKYWQALFVKVRSKISQSKLSDKERRYAFWLLKGYDQFASFKLGSIPKPIFDIELVESRKTIVFLQRAIKRLKGKPPTVKKARIVKFDANCYEVFEHKGRQYIKLMTLQKKQRLIIPLLGKAKIQGNITAVINKNSIDINVSQDLKARSRQKNECIEAVDFGYTEVMTDTQGIRYGKEFGEILTKKSDHLHKKMQKRHKLHALEKKASNPHKADRISERNLGRQKLSNEMRRTKATLEREINTAIEKLIKLKNPSVLVTEDLSHLFTYRKSKAMNRRLSLWTRGTIQDRIHFKALAEGFRHEQVNPAYGSQTCPICEFVDQKNRIKDSFKCIHCEHEDSSDRVAALNYAKRFGDGDIGLYTPYRQVKTILLAKFHRRLETGQPVTVPGRTLETVSEVDPPFY